MSKKFTFFSTNIHENVVEFDETEMQHMIHTLRYKPGENIEFTDGKGFLYNAQISVVNKKNAIAQIIGSQYFERTQFLHLYIGNLRISDRMEWLIEKATELEVKSLGIFIGKKSEKKNINLDRFKKIAIAAMKQSHGKYLPEFTFIPKLQKIQLENSTFAPICNNQIQKKLISHIDFPRRCNVIIGPEGDFDEEEIAWMQENKVEFLDLGNAILRTETAAIAMASKYHFQMLF